MKIIRQVLIERTMEFEWKGPGPPGHAYTSITAYFHGKTKISKKILEWIIIYR